MWSSFNFKPIRCVFSWDDWKFTSFVKILYRATTVLSGVQSVDIRLLGVLRPQCHLHVIPMGVNIIYTMWMIIKENILHNRDNLVHSIVSVLISSWIMKYVAKLETRLLIMKCFKKRIEFKCCVLFFIHE